jgi:hypothetical protein
MVAAHYTMRVSSCTILKMCPVENVPLRAVVDTHDMREKHTFRGRMSDAAWKMNSAVGMDCPWLGAQCCNLTIEKTPTRHALLIVTAFFYFVSC